VPRATVFAVLALAAAAALAVPRPVRAQATRADSAAMLLDTAHRLEAQGSRAAVSALLEEILRRFGDTPAADEARRWRAARPAEPERNGRLELIAWSTLYGIELGVFIPGSMDVQNGTVYGLGLVIGGPAGYYGARAYADANHPTLGQARAMTFGFRWGEWQAAGWYGTLANNVTAPGTFTALVIGGVGGMTAAAVYGKHHAITAGAAASASQGAYWGSWFGLVADVLFDIDGLSGTKVMLLAGDAGMVGGVLAAPREITDGQVWMTSALGLAGMAMGGGVDLIIQPSSGKVAIAIPAIGSAVGLAMGFAQARAAEHGTPAGGAGGGRGAAPGMALLEWDSGGPRIGAPLVSPSLVPVGERGPRRIYRPALSVPLFHATF
jgi:hypothetical protein